MAIHMAIHMAIDNLTFYIKRFEAKGTAKGYNVVAFLRGLRVKKRRKKDKDTNANTPLARLLVYLQYYIILST